MDQMDLKTGLLDRTLKLPFALGGGAGGLPPGESAKSYIAPSVFVDGAVGEGLASSASVPVGGLTPTSSAPFKMGAPPAAPVAAAGE